MLQAHREAEIIKVLKSSKVATVDDLTQSLGVSASTVRRDLSRLDTQGALQRVRGGAKISGDADADRPFPGVAATNAADKAAVASKAAELVEDGQVLFLDIGTTTASLATHLRGRQLTVVTSNLAAFDVLREDPMVELILLGGVVRQAYRSMVGLLTELALEQVRADLAFIGTSGVTDDGQVLDTTSVEVPVKQSLMAAADKSILVADKHKFPGTGVMKVCDLARFDTLVTNEGSLSSAVTYCEHSGVEVVRG